MKGIEVKTFLQHAASMLLWYYIILGVLLILGYVTKNLFIYLSILSFFSYAPIVLVSLLLCRLVYARKYRQDWKKNITILLGLIVLFGVQIYVVFSLFTGPAL